MTHWRSPSPSSLRSDWAADVMPSRFPADGEHVAAVPFEVGRDERARRKRRDGGRGERPPENLEPQTASPRPPGAETELDQNTPRWNHDDPAGNTAGRHNTTRQSGPRPGDRSSPGRTVRTPRAHRAQDKNEEKRSLQKHLVDVRPLAGVDRNDPGVRSRESGLGRCVPVRRVDG